MGSILTLMDGHDHMGLGHSREAEARSPFVSGGEFERRQAWLRGVRRVDDGGRGALAH